MSVATLTEKGQIEIPAEIRARYDLIPGTKFEILDEGGTIRLLVRRRIAASDPAAGYGLVKVKPSPSRPRRLSGFDPAATLKSPRRKK
jgi:AbrB family looped-hinge helix DNA binding protein